MRLVFFNVTFHPFHSIVTLFHSWKLLSPSSLWKHTRRYPLKSVEILLFLYCFSFVKEIIFSNLQQDSQKAFVMLIVTIYSVNYLTGDDSVEGAHGRQATDLVLFFFNFKTLFNIIMLWFFFFIFLNFLICLPSLHNQLWRRAACD